ncbi:MAG: ABC transporter ATP-binding protein [Dethiosulfatibacter sp.]|nr:ABC transporter ATP-binding protein [Dethiosulfatibacter sp.]
MKTVLEVNSLEKRYKDRVVLDGLNLKVEEGDIYGFLGPNGAGKTTAIRAILGLIHFQKGNVILNGYDIKKDFRNAIRAVGAMVETPQFLDQYSGLWNLRMMAKFYDGITEKRIDEALEIIGMKTRAKDRVRTYSMGMKQRLGIAGALLHRPSLVILDEPTNGLDPQGIKEIREIIMQLSIEQNMTFFISSHILSEVESFCNKVGIIKDGRIIKELTSEKIPVKYAIPQNRSLEEYFLELTKGGKQVE